MASFCQAPHAMRTAADGSTYFDPPTATRVVWTSNRSMYARVCGQEGCLNYYLHLWYGTKVDDVLAGRQNVEAYTPE